MGNSIHLLENHCLKFVQHVLSVQFHLPSPSALCSLLLRCAAATAVLRRARPCCRRAPVACSRCDRPPLSSSPPLSHLHPLLPSCNSLHLSSPPSAAAAATPPLHPAATVHHPSSSSLPQRHLLPQRAALRISSPPPPCALRSCAARAWRP